MDREELPDAIPDRPVLLCAEPECDRPPTPGDRRCALHAARLGSLPGRPVEVEAPVLEVVPEHQIVRVEPAPWRRATYRRARVVAWSSVLTGLTLVASLPASLELPLAARLALCTLISTSWVVSGIAEAALLVAAEKRLSPGVLLPLLGTLALTLPGLGFLLLW